MCFICSNCLLNAHIEKGKETLNNLIIAKCDMLDPSVLKASEALDELIYECTSCKAKKAKFSLLSMYTLSGTHTSFYYYGTDHLITNVIQYIKKGLENNEIIYLTMVEGIYNRLIGSLESLGIPTKNIFFADVSELILEHKHNSLKGLKEKIDFYQKDSYSKGFKSIRWIGQPTFAITHASEMDFLNWEKDLNTALKDTNISLLCVYDFYDYMNGKGIINTNVINESYLTHPTMMYKFNVVSLIDKI